MKNYSSRGELSIAQDNHHGEGQHLHKCTLKCKEIWPIWVIDAHLAPSYNLAHHYTEAIMKPKPTD